MLLCWNKKHRKAECFCAAGPLQESGPAEIRRAAPADSPEELPAPPVPAGAAGAAARGAAGPHLHHQRKYPCWGSLCSSSSIPAGGRQAACKQDSWKLLRVWVKVERNQNMWGESTAPLRKSWALKITGKGSRMLLFYSVQSTWIYIAVVKGSVR